MLGFDTIFTPPRAFPSAAVERACRAAERKSCAAPSLTDISTTKRSDGRPPQFSNSRESFRGRTQVCREELMGPK